MRSASTTAVSFRVTLGAVVVMALLVVLALPGSAHASFTDTAGSPYAAAIDGLADLDIVSGFGDGTFGPNVLVTRQQFAKMAVKTLDLAVTGDEVCPFVDVDLTPDPKDAFYPAKYVAVCANHNITKGKQDATHFAPHENITLQQLITMMVRATNPPEPPAGFVAPFTAGEFSLEEHYLNARKAAFGGLLDGLAGLPSAEAVAVQAPLAANAVGFLGAQAIMPDIDFTRPATRGECAQVQWNVRRKLHPQTLWQISFDGQVIEWQDFPGPGITGRSKQTMNLEGEIFVQFPPKPTITPGTVRGGIEVESDMVVEGFHAHGEYSGLSVDGTITLEIGNSYNLTTGEKGPAPARLNPDDPYFGCGTIWMKTVGEGVSTGPGPDVIWEPDYEMVAYFNVKFTKDWVEFTVAPIANTDAEVAGDINGEINPVVVPTR